MELYNKKMDCFGCRACESACPSKAITMESDEQGFWYPHIDEEKCISCGMCQNACQIGKIYNLRSNHPMNCFGVKCQDDIRLVSSSGGVYTALSDYVLENDGLCVGAEYDNNMRVVHSIAESKEMRNRFRGSKYVQSDMYGVYEKIKQAISYGKYVLYTSTPCQCAAVKQYMSKKSDVNGLSRLILVDMVCHGVPSPAVWMDYVKYMENDVHAEMNNYVFRNKEVGWRNYNVKASFVDGSVRRNDRKSRTYVQLFSRDVMLRPSCYYCPYSKMSRCSDLTIGDFWGIEDIDEGFSDNKGVSMLLVNTEKGQALWERCKSKVAVYKEIDVAKLMQPQLHNSVDYSIEYDAFWKDYLCHGYRFVATKYGGASKYYEFLRKVKNRLRRM